MVRAAFFRGKGTLADAIVRLLTRSQFSRVELAVGHKMATGWACYAADPVEGHLRRRIVDLDPENWVIVEVPGVSKTRVQNWFKANLGRRVNMQHHLCLPFWQEGERCGKYAPGEAAAAAIGMVEPSFFSVDRLYRALTRD
jgi:hypothetical protein